MNTEDKFYFGKPGQPARFGRTYSGKSKRLNNGTTVAAWDDGDAAQFVNSTQAQAFSDKHGLGGVYQSPSSRAFFVLASKATASRPGQPERFAEIKDSDLYAMHDALNKRAIAANKNGDTALAAKYESWIERVQDMISLAREGQQERLRKYAQGLPIELRRMLPKILFSKSHSANQPERFDRYGYEKMEYDRLTRESWYLKDSAEYAMSLGRKDPELRQKIIALQKEFARRGFTAAVTVLAAFLRKPFSRPGQPERFDMEGACWEGYEPVGTKQKDGKTVPNCVPMKNAAGGEEKFGKQVISTRGSKRAEISGPDANGQWRAYVIQKSPTGLPSEPYHEDLLGDMKFFDTEEKARRAASKMLASRPGQPDTFDASSLERGAFAEASKSPMLGKLLAAKAMPDGGWRAVQVGSDTLVISFEDADLARDFGRRASTKGYSATSPIATTGRYWNVEVKNGK